MRSESFRGEPTAPEVREKLRFDRTVPRALVHRASVAEVFLTDSCRLDRDRFLVAAQWPRNHALYQLDAAGYSDPMLLAETVRQAAIFLVHRFYDVPLTRHFIFCDLDFRIENPAPFRAKGGVPLQVVLDSSFTCDPEKPDGRFGARVETSVEVGGVVCARAAVRFLVVGSAQYRRLRYRRAAPAPLPVQPPPMSGAPCLAADAGLRRAENVLLSPAPVDEVGEVGEANGTVGTVGTGVTRKAGEAGSWRLRLDTRHPGYFEHPSDHVPGMVLVEAFRQAGHLLIGQGAPGHGFGSGVGARHVPVASRVSFGRFGELHEHVTITAREGGSARPGAPVRTVLVAALQGGNTLAQAEMVYRLRPGV
ncbi:ScbA/BarX family gamma-butyrolactone biosynthesis protein [Streptomyces sp. DT24]|uniref:ScbA/BarX family gamma-butyrolactone biosynthesis protein n=1 Tax=Streptomyces sp. DT24 TaxID=3416520 RepID=UPI003CEFBC2E